METGSIPFSEISGIEIEASPGEHPGTLHYRLAIQTPHGSVPLASSYGSSDRGRYAEQRDRILLFLGAPPPPGKPAEPAEASAMADVDQSVRALLNAGRKIDAIALLRSSTSMSLSEAKRRVGEMERAMKAGSTSLDS